MIQIAHSQTPVVAPPIMQPTKLVGVNLKTVRHSDLRMALSVVDKLIGSLGCGLQINRGRYGVRYRLLDTTRAYALDIRIDETEAADLAVRHATYYRQWLDQSGAGWSNLSTGTEQAPHFAALNNLLHAGATALESGASSVDSPASP